MKHLTIIIAVVLLFIAGEVVAQQGRGNTRQTREENRGRAQQRIQGTATAMKAVGDSAVAIGRGRRMEDQTRGVASRQREQAAGEAEEAAGKAETKADEAGGRAPGGDKGELKDREFGQAVAALARMQSVEGKITEVELKVSAGREKIAEARQKIEEKKNGKEMTEEEYLKKKAELDTIEKEMERIEAESVKQKNKIQEVKGKK